MNVMMFLQSKLRRNYEFEKAEKDWLTPPEDRRPIKTLCDSCGEKIREGDEVYTSPFKNVCKECLEDMSAMDFIKDVLEEKLERA